MTRFFIFFMVMFVCAQFLPAEELRRYPDIYQSDTDGDFPISNEDFSHGYILSFDADDIVTNCNFEGTTIEMARFSCDKNCNLKDTWVLNGTIDLAQEQWVQTRNFKMKRFKEIVFHKNIFRNLDFSDFKFEHSGFYDVQFVNCNFENAVFQCCTMPVMSVENWKQTWNYRNGALHTLRIKQDFNNIDLSRCAISGFVWNNNTTTAGIRTPSPGIGKGVDLTDTVFFLCDLRKSKDLTPEQVRQTWNFKNGRMDLVQWPEHIVKSLDLPRYLSPNKWKFQDEYFEIWNLEQMKDLDERFRANILFMGLSSGKVYQTDLSKMLFFHCAFVFLMKETDISDAVFLDCDLTAPPDLTLEQVKSTWNYKAGRMSLCKWPKHIEKALEEEEKAKAQEEKK